MKMKFDFILRTEALMSRLIILLFLTATAFAQSAPIQDNSFLAEEAYNQETGVVQHINAFSRQSDGTWAYTFTQEWPVPHHSRHQLSYTLASVNSGSGGAGWGDTLLNYRYQLIGDGDSKLAFSPRISAVLPSGSTYWARGVGGAGVQVAAPVSLVLTKSVVSHWDLGATFIPRASNAIGDRAATQSFYAAQSFVWLAKPRFNALVETAYFNNESVLAPSLTARASQLYISPGVRWAYNLSHGLQIVPGVAAPIGVGSSAGQKGVFVYLSFEHPMWHEQER